jgi:hypothetical protein
MKDYRILNASETGRGILVEMDAGWISPSDPKNVDILREQKELDYRSTVYLIETVECILKRF